MSETAFNNQQTALQCNRWLKIQGSILLLATKGCLVVSSHPEIEKYPQEENYFWPDNTDNQTDLIRICRRAKKEGRGVLLSFKEDSGNNSETTQYVHIAYPVTVNKELSFTAAFEIHQEDKQQVRLAMMQLECSLRFLAGEFTTDGPETSVQSSSDTLFTVVKKTLRCSHYEEAVQSLIDSLAEISSCHRVSLGCYARNNIKIEAISNQSTLNSNSPLILALASAMEECIDQGAEIQYPQEIEEPGPISTFHKNLAAEHGSSVAFSLPLPDTNFVHHFILLFEHNTAQQLPTKSINLYRDIAQVIGPLLWAKQQQEYGVVRFIALRLKGYFARYKTHKRTTQSKALVMLCLLLFCFFAKGDFRVPADVNLSGTILRGITAPFPGYVSEANKSAGDRVAKGEALAQLDTSDLTLEELTWNM